MTAGSAPAVNVTATALHNDAAPASRHAAAATCDFLVGNATEALFEFLGTVAGENQVRMAVDERRRRPAAVERAAGDAATFGQPRGRAHPVDTAIANRDGAVLDDAVGTGAFRHRCEMHAFEQ